ncbi:MAG: carbohydrate ABC transporter permease [Nitrososphaerales archaeon]
MMQRITSISFYLLVAIISLIFLFPIYWTIITSLKSVTDIFSRPPILLPYNPVLENYYRPFFIEGYTKLFINSLIASIGNVIVVIPLSTLAAYALSRYKFLGANTFQFFALTCRMAPPAAFIVPYYLMFRSLGLLDTPIALIIAYTIFNIPLAIWIIKSGFDSIPYEVEESATIDGASLTARLIRISIPLCAPSIAAATILVFLFAWNEYLFASVLTGFNARTITTGLTAFITEVGIRWGEMAAVSVVCMIPGIILVIFLQKYIVKGLSLGGVRG